MRILGGMVISVCMVSSVLAEQRKSLAELFTATWCIPCG